MGALRDNKIISYNGGISNGRNQDNQQTIVKNVMDGITDPIDPINRVFAEIWTYIFGL